MQKDQSNHLSPIRPKFKVILRDVKCTNFFVCSFATLKEKVIIAKKCITSEISIIILICQNWVGRVRATKN